MLSDSMKRMIRHAYTSVSMYQALVKEHDIVVDGLDTMDSFLRLPIIGKEMVQRAGSGAVSSAYLQYPLSNKLSIQRTSGSTGQYMKIYWSENDLVHSLAELWLLRLKRYGISPQDKYCYFYTTDYINNTLVDEKPETLSPLNRSLGFSKSGLTEDRVREICEKINVFQPKWLMLQPSMALILGSGYLKNNLPIPDTLKYIELTGEFLFDGTRKELEEIFHCHIGNQYGCNEVGSIAAECREGVMHCMHSNVYVEILKDGMPVPDGEEGEIVVTSLTNYAMPFIRYAIGDRGAIWRNQSCSCDYGHTLLKLVSGRINEFALTDNGVKIAPYIFVRPIEYINEKVGNIIRQFQVIQTQWAPCTFLVKMVIRKSYFTWREVLPDLYLQYLKEPLLTNARWEFEFSDIIFPNDQSGKLAYFINHISTNDEV